MYFREKKDKEFFDVICQIARSRQPECYVYYRWLECFFQSRWTCGQGCQRRDIAQGGRSYINWHLDSNNLCRTRVLERGDSCRAGSSTDAVFEESGDDWWPAHGGARGVAVFFRNERYGEKYKKRDEVPGVSRYKAIASGHIWRHIASVLVNALRSEQVWPSNISFCPKC